MFNKIIIPSLLFLITFISTLVSANENIVYKGNNFSNDGYRSKIYRSPTPTQASFATIVDAEDILKLSKENKNLVIVNVVPLDMDGSTFIQAKPHEGIVNSIWLPNVGYGQIDEMTKNYLVENLNLAMNNNSDTVFIFYCKIDCWMSWNAARRASLLGFKNIFWYKNGIETWKYYKLKTELLHPEAFIK
jgi:PQQ-dependent catabolism-associated CXXCW motif protein